MPNSQQSQPAKRDHGLLRQKIVEQLLAEVFRGRLTAGRHLVTQELAERFEVSHTPIREALIALAGIGIIDLVPNCGAVVRRVTSREVIEVMQVRRALECEAVRLACGRIDLGELHRLAADLTKLAEAKQPYPARLIEQSRNIDSRLHDLVANSCGNRFLANELNRLKILFRAFRDVSYTQDKARNDLRRLGVEAREHLAIVEALRAGDRKGAWRAMLQHLQGGVKYWARALPDPVDGSPLEQQIPRFMGNGIKHSRPVRNGAGRNGAGRNGIKRDGAIGNGATK
jgi:DNA-binding GntR family transcriptional regulator